MTSIIPPKFVDKFGDRMKQRNSKARPYGRTSVVGSYKRFLLKLIQFHDNIRPAFFGRCLVHPSGALLSHSGSFSKEPNAVRSRRPFVKETTIDYEVDSDEEWEEEEGESIDSDQDSAPSENMSEDEDNDVRAGAATGLH